MHFTVGATVKTSMGQVGEIRVAREANGVGVYLLRLFAETPWGLVPTPTTALVLDGEITAVKQNAPAFANAS